MALIPALEALQARAYRERGMITPPSLPLDDHDVLPHDASDATPERRLQ